MSNMWIFCNIIAFSTSFGGYLTLLYNYYYTGTFSHIILRSPAIKMYDVLFYNILTQDMKDELESNNCFDFGFERIIKITDKFVNDIKENNILSLYGNQELNYVSIIHGTKDDVVPISDSLEFAELHNCSIYTVEGADHRYKNPGELDKVIDISCKILSNN